MSLSGTGNDLNDLLSAIRRTLGAAYLPPLNTRVARWALYEAYIFCLILEEAVRRGASPPVFRNGDGSRATVYRFRTGPGRLSANDPYTYAVLEFGRMSPPKLPLEVHLGIYVSGSSFERTQSDVCVLFQEEADFFRTQAVRRSQKRPLRWWPDASKVILTVECKYLQRNLPASTINEAIGRYKDLSATRHVFVTNTRSLAAGNRVVACFSSDAWQWRVVPSSPEDEARFRSMLNGVFNQYIVEMKHLAT